MGSYIDVLLDNKIQNIKKGTNTYSTGYVSAIQDYMLVVRGMENVGFYEKVIITGKAEGYVDYIGRNDVKVALTRITQPIVIGDIVVTTRMEFDILYSESSIGHIIDIFGEDKLAGKLFDDLERLPLETPPIPIMERSPVVRPLETGIIGIDLLYPIGKGQRQLIIGDKKTGKSQIALDTIKNQLGKNMLCIYVAVGKTKKEVKEVYNQLYQQGALGYTIIIAAFNDQCPPVLCNTPYAAMTIAEKYMREGRDVLVVIDDLKRHADVCREVNLLAGKVPGRDAYPPDIFYTHAGLLEKGCQHRTGGSITVLPICETKGGDISDYISTNIISITDGQLVMNKKNFNKGQKPAIDYGLSVSRLGGAVQTSRMKLVGTATRRELLSYLETKDIFELANVEEMGESVRNKMQRGKKLLEKLKQKKYSPVSPEEMINIFSGINSD